MVVNASIEVVFDGRPHRRISKSCDSWVPKDILKKHLRVERSWGNGADQQSAGNITLLEIQKGQCVINSNEPLDQHKFEDGRWRYIFHRSEVFECDVNSRVRFRTFWHSAGPLYYVDHHWMKEGAGYTGTFSDSNGRSGKVRARAQ